MLCDQVQILTGSTAAGGGQTEGGKNRTTKTRSLFLHSQADRMVIRLGCIGSGEKGLDSGQIHFEDRANRLTDGLDVKEGERKKGDKNDARVFA